MQSPQEVVDTLLLAITAGKLDRLTCLERLYGLESLSAPSDQYPQGKTLAPFATPADCLMFCDLMRTALGSTERRSVRRQDAHETPPHSERKDYGSVHPPL